MGITLGSIITFFESGYVDNPYPHVLDVGCSNIHTIDAELAQRFVRERNDIYEAESMRRWARYFAAGGLMDPEIGGTNGAWLGDLLERAGMRYKAYDIFPGYNTELFDLNAQPIPEADAGKYDVVFNFGTTEHVLGQYNAFKVMHDAAKVGGVIYHDLPMTGYLNHGFYNYNPVMLVSIAEANGYQILKLRFSGGLAGETIESRLVPSYDREPYYAKPNSPAGWIDAQIPTAAVSLIARKLKDAPFRASLEMTTTAGVVPDEIQRQYGADREDLRSARALVRERTQDILGRIKDPSLTPEELRLYHEAFVNAGFREAFPPSIELRMLDDALKTNEGDEKLTARRAVVLNLLRQQYPLLKAVDAEADQAMEATNLALDGREAGFDNSGSEAGRFQRIVAAYREYHDRSAVELFPLELEAEGLQYMTRTRPRDPYSLIRLGKVMGLLTPKMTIKRRDGAQGTAGS